MKGTSKNSFWINLICLVHILEYPCTSCLWKFPSTRKYYYLFTQKFLWFIWPETVAKSYERDIHKEMCHSFEGIVHWEKSQLKCQLWLFWEIIIHTTHCLLILISCISRMSSGKIGMSHRCSWPAVRVMGISIPHPAFTWIGWSRS